MISTITRRGILAVAFALAAGHAGAQDDAAARRFSDNAKAALTKLEQGIRIVRPAAKGPGFVRVEWHLTGTPAMDVKRTDSVLEPVRATIEVPVRMGAIPAVPTEAEAETAPVAVTEDFKVQAVYVPTNGGWALKSARAYVKGLGRWMEGRSMAEEVVVLFEVAPPAPAPAAAPQPAKRGKGTSA